MVRVNVYSKDLPSTSRYAVDSTSLATKRISPASSALTLHISRKCLVPTEKSKTICNCSIYLKTHIIIRIIHFFPLNSCLTFSSNLDSAGGPDLVSIFVPFPSHILQRHLTHEHCILVLLDVKVLQFLHHLQFVLCEVINTQNLTVNCCNLSVQPKDGAVS